MIKIHKMHERVQNTENKLCEVATWGNGNVVTVIEGCDPAKLERLFTALDMLADECVASNRPFTFASGIERIRARTEVIDAYQALKGDPQT